LAPMDRMESAMTAVSNRAHARAWGSVSGRVASRSIMFCAP